MTRRISITAGGIQITAALNETPTATQLWNALPIQATANVWGDEIYFRIPVQADEHDAVEVVDMGAIAYWPPGQALCLFFGKTPASVADEIRPASPVNVLGSIQGDPTALKAVPPGAPVLVQRIE